MGTYNIPRDTKGEGRLFYIFSTKALLWTVGGVIIGAIIRFILKFLGSLFKAEGIFSVIGIVIMVIFAIIGFIIGTFKLPKNDKFEITRKAAGVGLDKILIESIKFKLNKNKLYVYDTSELVREEIRHEIDVEQKNQEKEQKLLQEKLDKDRRDRRGYIR